METFFTEYLADPSNPTLLVFLMDVVIISAKCSDSLKEIRK